MEKLTKDELEEIVEELESYRGRHTELITVYVSAGYDTNAVQKQLEAEKATAKNIKSSSTRKNVIDALEKIVRYLKEFKKTPENGLAIFCGNVSEKEGEVNIQLWGIHPPMALKSRLYRCDKEFVLDDLKKMLEVDEIYGLLVMDRKEATIGMLKGKIIEPVQKLSSGVPSKIRAGGQSSQRFHRITEGLVKEFYKRVAEEMKKTFFNMSKLKGILVGGPIPTKDEFLEGEYMTTKLMEKVIGKIDTGDVDESGLKELVVKSKDILANQEIIHEQNALNEFFETLGSNPGKAILGEENVKTALNYGAVEILLLSKKIDKKVFAELKKAGKSIDSNIEFISDETEVGQQFYNMGGIGAILRFRIK